MSTFSDSITDRQEETEDTLAAHHADDIERSCLSAVLYAPAEWSKIAQLTPAHFGKEAHRVIFQAMKESGTPDYWSLCTHLSQHGKEGYVADLTEIQQDVFAGGLAGVQPAWVAKIQATALRRILFNTSQQLAGASVKPSLDPISEARRLAEYLMILTDAAAPEGAPSGLISAADFLQEPDIPDLVEKMVPAHGLAMCAAGEGQLKSFTIDDLLFHIAAGKPWHGHKIIKPGPVVFVLNEGYRGFKKRLRAWEQHHQCQIRDKVFIRKPDAAHLPFRLNDAGDVAALVRDAQQAGAVAICFDTLSSILPGVNPNGGDGGMLLALDHARRIETQAGVLCLFAHHTNKGGADVKGATDFIYGMDVRFSTKAEKDQRGIPTSVTVHCEKPRDDEPFPDLVFSAQRVSVPTEDDPHATSLALEPDYHATKADQTPKLAGNDLAAYQALTEPMGYIAWRDKSGIAPGSWARTVKNLCNNGRVQEPAGDGLYRRMPERLPVSSVSNRYHDTNDTGQSVVSQVSSSLEMIPDTDGDTSCGADEPFSFPGVSAQPGERNAARSQPSPLTLPVSPAAPSAAPVNQVETFGATALQPERATQGVQPTPAPAVPPEAAPDDETPTDGRLKAQQKGWPVDPQKAEREHALLECLPERSRGWNVCVEAVHAYVVADEPSYPANFFGRPTARTLAHKPLWQEIGHALDVGGEPMSQALALLERIRGAKA